MKKLAAVLALMAGCAVNIPQPDALMAGGDEARLAELRGGRTLYVNKCSGCHSLHPVDRFSDGEWTSEVQEMLKQKKLKLSPDERDHILLYLTTANGR